MADNPNKPAAGGAKARVTGAHVNETRGHTAIYAASALALILTGTIVERVARLHEPQAGDWIMIATSVAVTSILFTLVITARGTDNTHNEDGMPGHAEAAVFDLGKSDVNTIASLAGSLDDRSGVSGSAGKSVGELAQSIRDAASEVARITDQLASAHEGAASGNPESRSPESTIKALLDSQGEALTRIDSAAKAAAIAGEETSRAGEALAAIVELATAHAGHGRDHAKALESIANLTALVLRKTSDAVVHARVLERDRDALALNAQEYLSSLHQMKEVADASLIAFRDGARSLDDAVSGPGVDPESIDPASAPDTGVESPARDLTARVSKVAECIQMARMNQRLRHNAPASPSSLRAIETSLDEAEALLREVRDAAAMIEITLGRATEKHARVIAGMRTEMENTSRAARQADHRGRVLSRLAGEMAQAMGQLRINVQADASRMEQILSRPLSAHATGELQPILQELHEKAATVAQGNSRAAIDGQRQNMDSLRIKAICADLKASTDASRDKLGLVQQSSGAAALKVESMVRMVQSVVGREDGVTRRSAANTARIAIREKVAMIDHFATRVMEVEHKSKRLSGPSPALDRSEMENLPEYNVPVQ
ncbi:hypothetical protein EBZ80_16280 [bacterium]|nr:hypothetical protein [bacterium]